MTSTDHITDEISDLEHGAAGIAEDIATAVFNDDRMRADDLRAELRFTTDEIARLTAQATARTIRIYADPAPGFHGVAFRTDDESGGIGGGTATYDAGASLVRRVHADLVTLEHRPSPIAEDAFTVDADAWADIAAAVERCSAD